MARDFKIELDNVEMINGSDDLLKDTKVTKVTLTGENKLNSLNSTFENCDELTSIEGEVNLDGVSDMTEMALNTTLDELKVINPTEENIQADNSLNQVTNVKIGGAKYAKGGVQDVVGSLDWNAENFVYEDAILDNVYTNSASIEESKNITVSDTLEQKATSIEIIGQTYENLVDGKATENLLDEMSMQQTEGKPTQFTPHMEQPICLEYIEGKTYQNLIEGKGEYNLTNKATFIPLGLQPNKDYTLQLDSVGKDNKPITVNLGGATTTIQPTNDTSKHHRVSLTTPSSLTTDNLDLSGEGVIVNDVMLFEGNTSVIKQDVDYMDGIQSVGELIENKNLFDYTQSELGFLSISTGGISSNISWKYTTKLISVKPNTTYCISQASNPEFYYNIVEYNSSQSYLKGTSWEDNSGAISNRIYNTFTTSANTYYIRLNWKVSTSNIQLEKGLIPTEFRVFGSERYKIEIETYDSRWDSI